MGWMISVGRAGAAKGGGAGEAAQAMSMRMDGPGVMLRLSVGHGEPGAKAAPVPAWQAERVWQKVLHTVVGID